MKLTIRAVGERALLEDPPDTTTGSEQHCIDYLRDFLVALEVFDPDDDEDQEHLDEMAALSTLADALQFFNAWAEEYEAERLE